MIHRWIHRRAVLAWLLLPWLALGLAAAGIALIDLLLGDGVVAQDWRLRPRTEWLWPALGDAAPLLAGLYGGGTLAWALGILMGGRSARRASVVLGLLCAAAVLALADWAGFPWLQPVSLWLGAVALFTGSLYAALTHRPSPQVRRMLPRSAQPPPPPPPAPAPPVRPPVAPPIPTLMRHEPPTTQPVEY